VSPGKFPPAFHIMAKPSGSDCNLRCDYCFFLKKDRLYPESDFRMSDGVHEAYIRQLLEAHNVPQVTVAWQGGEPTLMGLTFSSGPWSFKRNMQSRERESRTPSRPTASCSTTNGADSFGRTTSLSGSASMAPESFTISTGRTGEGTEPSTVS